MNTDDLHYEITDILRKVTKCLELKDFEIEFNLKSDKGNGFLGELFMGSVINKENGTTKHIAIKKAPNQAAILRKYSDFSLAYQNENYFYSTVYPDLVKFQKDHARKFLLNVVPQYFFGSSELYKEAVVMENLFHCGYQLHDKVEPLGEDKIELIFETYGKFHALSCAYKDQKPQEYAKTVSNLQDYCYKVMRELHKWGDMLLEDSKSLIKYMRLHGLDEFANKFEPIGNNIWGVFRDICIYKGDYSAILHGDCWSNNMMFKYDADMLVDMKIIDFQLSRTATPVFDLSYFIYAGGSKRDFDKLDHYLDIYYNSFSKFANDLGSDPQKIYPLEELKKDWIKYSKFGIIMGLGAVNARTKKKEEIADMVTNTTEEGNLYKKVNQDTDILFHTTSADIIIHACEYNIL